MQEELDIKISMLLDDELESEEAVEILSQMRNDSELRSKWLRYNAISCVLKGKPAALPDDGFFDRVSKAVDQEAPYASANGSQRKNPLKRPPIAIALAASVAVAAVIVWSDVPFFVNTWVGQSNQMSLVMSSPSPVKVPTQALKVESGRAERPALPHRLNDYLITHNESTYSTGTQAVMPFARVISYSYDR